MNLKYRLYIRNRAPFANEKQLKNCAFGLVGIEVAMEELQ